MIRNRVQVVASTLAIALGSVVWWSAVAFAEQPPPIDVTQGEIDGKAAFFCGAFEGFEYEPDSDLLEDPSLKVHFVPDGGLEDTVVLPANEWVLPPTGRFKYWLEGDGWMSPTAFIMGFGEVPFAERNRGFAVLRPVVPAGEICVSPEAEAPAGVVLRLVHVDSHNRGRGPHREISREVTVDRSPVCVRMPEGEVLAAWFDTGLGEYHSLSPLAQVSRSEPAMIEPRPPARSGTDVIAVLDRPVRAASFDDYDVELSLRSPNGGAARPADVQIPTAGRIYGIWYDLDDRVRVMEASSGKVFMEPQEIVLRPGKVERVSARLQPKPDLTVTLDLPESLPSDAPRKVSLLEWPSSTVLATREVPASSREVVFEDVTPGRLGVTVQASPWLFGERVDLSDGLDAEVLIQPTPIEIRGTVFRGSEPHAATVSFTLDSTDPDGRMVVETDERGRYEATFLRDGYFGISVQLEGLKGEPYFQFMETALSESPTLDLHVPGNTVEVVVSDAATGEGVSGAAVRSYIEPSQPGDQVRSVLQTADSEGFVQLAPFQPGELTLWVEADGYRAADPVSLTLAELDDERHVEVVLQPDAALDALTLRLPDGRPADAELVAIAPGTSDPLWRGRTDGDGFVEVPERAIGSFLAVRPSEGAPLVRRWDPAEVHPNVTWTLQAEGPPLSVTVEDSGGEPVARAAVVLQVDGCFMRGGLLKWLTGSDATDESGTWRPHSLPAHPAVLVAGVGRDMPMDAGIAAALGIEIPFPRIDDHLSVRSIR